MNEQVSGSVVGVTKTRRRLSQFTLADNNNTWIFINPDHVISVLPGTEYTEITVLPSCLQFRPTVYRVREMADAVLDRLEV